MYCIKKPSCRIYFTILMAAILNFQDGYHIKHISINILASRWHTIGILVSNYMFSGSSNKTVPFSKAADGSHIWFSTWLSNVIIFLSVSQLLGDMRSKPWCLCICFLGKKIQLYDLEKYYMAVILDFQDGRHIKTYFCPYISLQVIYDLNVSV